MKLSAWLKQNSLTQQDFHKILKDSNVDVSTHAISKWCNGSRIPRQNEMKAIHIVTRAEVQPNDFYGLRNGL